MKSLISIRSIQRVLKLIFYYDVISLKIESSSNFEKNIHYKIRTRIGKLNKKKALSKAVFLLKI